MGSFDRISEISGEKLHELVIARGGKKSLACSPNCVIKCSNLIVDENGNHITSSFEYETMALNGTNLMIDNLDSLAKIDHLCDDVGVDTIEFGGSVPTVLRRGVPAIAKEPSLIIPLVGVAGGGVIESFKKQPVQTAATMGLTAGLVKGVTPKFRPYQPKPAKVFHRPPRVHVPMKVVKSKPGMSMWESEAASASLHSPLSVAKATRIRLKQIQRPRMPETEVILTKQIAVTDIRPASVAALSVPQITKPSVKQYVMPAIQKTMTEADIIQVKPETIQKERTKLLFGFKPASMISDVDVMQTQKIDQVMRESQLQKQTQISWAPSITKTKLKRIPKPLIPKMVLPTLEPEKRRVTKKMVKKAKAHKIVNPIADVEQVMKRVSGM